MGNKRGRILGRRWSASKTQNEGREGGSWREEQWEEEGGKKWEGEVEEEEERDCRRRSKRRKRGKMKE